jgi:phthalate 4,5-dioxygenase reductase component
MIETARTPVKVTIAEEVAQDIFMFELRHPLGSDLPEFTSGAHVSVQTPNGFLRKYSLCNDPSERDRYLIAVQKDPASRGGSTSMAADVKVGTELLISEPRNDFPLVKSPAGYTFVAGGIGITPILSMVRHLTSNGEGRFKLYYLTRSPACAAFRGELANPPFKGKVVFHHDQGKPENALDLWPLFEQPKGHVYCCGPRGLMDSVRDMTGHWPSSSIHFEAFAEPAKQLPNDRPFRVTLKKSGRSLDVPVGATILETLRTNGIDVPSSCESGTCGTCRTKLLAGAADHRDLVLAEHERNTNIMICVSRATSDELVLDL